MIYLRNQDKYIFHFPKTGGLFFKKVLNELGIPFSLVGNQHDAPGRPVSFDVRERGYVFMRKPSEWIWSYWRYRALSGDLSACEPWIRYHPTRKIDGQLSFSFNEFLNNLSAQRYELIKIMYFDFKPVENKIRFENLYSGISDLLGVKESIIRMIEPENVSTKTEFPKLREELVEELAALDRWFEEEFINF